MIRKEFHPKTFEAYKKFDKMLEGKNFVAGNTVTVADFQLFAEHLDTLYIQVDCDVGMTNVLNWRKRMMEIKSIREMHD